MPKVLHPTSRPTLRVPRPGMRGDPWPARAIYTPHAAVGDTDRFTNEIMPGGDTVTAGCTVYAIIKPYVIDDVVMRVISIENNPNNRSIYLALNSGGGGNNFRCFRNFGTTNQSAITAANTAYVNEWQFVAFVSPVAGTVPQVFVARYKTGGRLVEPSYSTQTAGAGTTQVVGDEVCLLNRVSSPTGGNGIRGAVALIHVVNRLMSKTELQDHVWRPQPISKSWAFWLLHSANTNSVALDITGNRRHCRAQSMSTAKMVKCPLPLSLFVPDDADFGFAPAPPAGGPGAIYHHFQNLGVYA